MFAQLVALAMLVAAVLFLVVMIRSRRTQRELWWDNYKEEPRSTWVVESDLKDPGCLSRE